MQSTAWRYFGRTKPICCGMALQSFGACRISTFDFGRTKPILIARRSWRTRYFWQNETNFIGGPQCQSRFGPSAFIKNDLAIIGKGPDRNQLDGSAEFCDATKCRGDCFR